MAIQEQDRMTTTFKAAATMLEEADEIVDNAAYLANRAGIQIQAAWLDPDAGGADLAVVLKRIDQRGNDLADQLTDDVPQGASDPEIALSIVHELCRQAADLQLGATLCRQAITEPL